MNVSLAAIFPDFIVKLRKSIKLEEHKNN